MVQFFTLLLCCCILLEHFSTGAQVLDGALLVQTLLLCWGSGAVLHFTTGAFCLCTSPLALVHQSWLVLCWCRWVPCMRPPAYHLVAA